MPLKDEENRRSELMTRPYVSAYWILLLILSIRLKIDLTTASMLVCSISGFL